MKTQNLFEKQIKTTEYFTVSRLFNIDESIKTARKRFIQGIRDRYDTNDDCTFNIDIKKISIEMNSPDSIFYSLLLIYRIVYFQK